PPRAPLFPYTTLFRSWMPVEEPAGHEPQRMHRRLLPEGPCRPEKPGVPFVDLGGRRQRIARMEIERHVEPLAFGPEAAVARVVQDRKSTRLNSSHRTI